MSISTGLDWTGNLAENADRSAASVDRLVQSLRSLQSTQSGGASIGGNVAGIGASAREANKVAVVQARGASDIATIQAQSDADRNRAIGRVVEGQAKAADAIAVEQNKSAQAALRAAEKASLVEQQGAQKSAQVREKNAAKLSEIEAKKAADLAKFDAKRSADADKEAKRKAKAAETAAKKEAAARVTEETTSGAGGAARAILEGKGIKGAIGAFGGPISKYAAVAEFAIDVGAKLAGLAKDYSAAVIEAQKFKEDITEAFKTVRGTNEAANRTFETAIKSADKLGIKRADSIAQFLDLATKGFDDTKIKEIQGRLFDITTIDPRASIEQLTKIIGQVKATGRVNAETLSMLATAGLEQADVIKVIGKALGKSDAEVLKKLSSAGGLRDERNVDFILAAIAGQTGGGAAGAKAAEKADRNLSSLITRLEDIPSNLLFDVQAGPGIESIKGVIRDVLSFFDASSATGQRTRKVLGDIFNAITEPLFGKRAGDKEGVAGTLNNLVDVAERSVPVIRSAAEGVGTLARAILALSSGDTSKLDASTKRVVGVINLVKEIGLLLAPGAFGGTFGPGGLIQPILDIIGIDADASEVRKWVDGIAGLLNPMNIIRTAIDFAQGGDGTLGNPILQSIQSAITGAVSTVSEGASSIGSFFIDGLVNGITTGAARVVAAVKSVAGSALSTAASVLRIGSPSRETTQYGEWYSEGMGIGIENKADYVSRAARLMAEDALVAGSMSVPRLGASPSATSRNGGASGDKRITIVLPPGPLVQIVAGPGTNVTELLEQLEPGIRALFIRIMQQVAQEA